MTPDDIPPVSDWTSWFEARVDDDPILLKSIDAAYWVGYWYGWHDPTGIHYHTLPIVQRSQSHKDTFDLGFKDAQGDKELYEKG